MCSARENVCVAPVGFGSDRAGRPRSGTVRTRPRLGDLSLPGPRTEEPRPTPPGRALPDG